MMLDRLIVYVDRTPAQLPEWERALSGSGVEVVRSLTNEVDAALVSVSRCEKFGSKAGRDESTLGKMEVFDSWAFEASRVFPRFQIANAVWRQDPPLLEAIDRRLDILGRTIDAYNASHTTPIRSLLVLTSVLGMWADYPAAQRAQAIEGAAARLRQMVRRP